jgi:hypothetical protein
MFTDTAHGAGRGSARRARLRGRWPGAVVLAAAAAGLLVAAPAGAQAPPRDATVFVHSARSGDLGGERLTLHGVSRRVTWAHNSGRSGVMAVKRMHRTLFAPMIGPATGTLHVAGHRGGDELTFKLTKPRFNLARRMVSYKIQRLGKGRLPSRAARAAGIARRFGAASLSIQGAPSPVVNVDLNVYNCTNGAEGTCWGTMSASGLRPGACCLSVSGPMVGGNTGQGVETEYRVDANGNVNAQLDLLCSNPYGVYISSITVDATQVGGPSNGYDAPGCG